MAGQDGVVVSPYDDLSFGPIDKEDPVARSRWVENELGYSDWQNIVQGNLPVLTASLTAANAPIAWVSPDRAQSVAGFLWWHSHMTDKEFFIVEVPGLSLLGPEHMARYLNQAVRFPNSIRQSSHSLWAKLQAENAPLRVLSESGLVSASIDYFDRDLLAHVTPTWKRMALIVGQTLYDQVDSEFHQTGDLMLAARLVSLAEAGELEWRGDLGDMHRCEMRLPARAQASRRIVS